MDAELESEEAGGRLAEGDVCEEGAIDQEGEAVRRTHEQEDAGKAAPTVWDRIVFRTKDGADREHDHIAGEVAVSRGPVRVARHEDDDDKSRHRKA